MTASATQLRPREPHVGFRDFVATRPDGEKWELIDGGFVMQAQPSVDHQIIAGNLERLLNDGLERLSLDRVALQNPALDLGPAVHGQTYVPDVAVIAADGFGPGQAVVATCHLAAEILSPSDRRRLPGSDRRKIAVKLAGYEALPACEAVLLVEQRAYDLTLALREDGAWVRRRLTGPEARLAVPSAGLDCRLGDLYARTTLARKGG